MAHQRSVIKQIPAAHARFMLVGRCGGGNLRLNSVVRPKTRSNYLLNMILPRAESPVKRAWQRAPDIAPVFALEGNLSHPFDGDPESPDHRPIGRREADDEVH